MAMNHSQALKHRGRFDMEGTYWQGRKWLHEDLRGNNSLLITVGDSWSWGDSLGAINIDQGILDDYDYRVTNIYGYHLANKLNCDWVNIAVCGTSNIAVMLKAATYIENLQKKYKHIQVIITLTESGRELGGSNFVKKQEEYNLLKGVDWPDFTTVVNGTNIDAILAECYANNLLIGYDLELYYAIKDANNINDFFIKYEAHTFRLIKKMFNHVSYLVGRNFTYSYDVNKPILGNQLMDNTWVDIIADAGQIDSYPKDVVVLSGIGLDPVLDFIKTSNLNNKEHLLPIISNANLGIDWLHNSKYNANIATKHPLEQAHQWWAEYIHKCLQY